MARDRVPVLKRCRSLNLDPIYLVLIKNLKDRIREQTRKCPNTVCR